LKAGLAEKRTIDPTLRRVGEVGISSLSTGKRWGVATGNRGTVLKLLMGETGTPKTGGGRETGDS